MQVLSKLIDLIKELAPFIMGWFGAKQDSKIEDLKNKVETIEDFMVIDNTVIKKEDLYKEDTWK